MNLSFHTYGRANLSSFTSQLKADILDLSADLSSGKHTNLGKAQAVQIPLIQTIQSDLQNAAARAIIRQDADFFFTQTELSLAGITAHIKAENERLLNLNSAPQEMASPNASAKAESIFTALVGLINRQSGGKFFFSGHQSHRAPLSDAKTILTALRQDLGATYTPDQLNTALNNWFDGASARFEQDFYHGDTSRHQTFQTNSGETLSSPLRGNSEAIKMMLKTVAQLILAIDAPMPAPDLAQIYQETATSLQSALDNFQQVRANLGVTHQRLDQQNAFAKKDKNALELQMAELTDINKYDTTVALQDAETRLQNLYLITAKLSKLSLIHFLK